MRVSFTLKEPLNLGIDNPSHREIEVGRLEQDREEICFCIDIDPHLLDETYITLNEKPYIIWAKIPRLLGNAKRRVYHNGTPDYVTENYSYLEVILDPL
jgi:hypothetical protein